MEKNIEIIQTILKSIAVTILTSLILGCIFTLVGLILNFWNETVANAAIGFMGAILIGTFSYFGLIVFINDIRE
tara:strand:- start:602 stop:823 length:222 start_codon:yes stop_codon:yes gene_type:complete